MTSNSGCLAGVSWFSSAPCTGLGECAPYNANRFSPEELEYHRSWDAARDIVNSTNGLSALDNMQVCYCDEGWTGYGNFGGYQHESLQYCGINLVWVSLLWGLFFVQGLALALRDSVWLIRHLNQVNHKSGGGTTRNTRVVHPQSNTSARSSTARVIEFSVVWKSIMRITSNLSFALIGVLRLWKPLYNHRIGVDVTVSFLYFTATAGIWHYIFEVQQRHTFMYFRGVFKDMGLGQAQLEQEYAVLKKTLRLFSYIAMSAGLFPLFGALIRTPESARTAWYLHLGAELIIMIVDQLIVNPRTYRRLLLVIERVAINNTSTPSVAQPGAVQEQQTKILAQITDLHTKARIRYYSRIAIQLPSSIVVGSLMVSKGAQFYADYGFGCWWLLHNFMFMYAFLKTCRRLSKGKERKQDKIKTNLNASTVAKSSLHTSDVSSFH